MINNMKIIIWESFKQFNLSYKPWKKIKEFTKEYLHTSHQVILEVLLYTVFDTFQFRLNSVVGHSTRIEMNLLQSA